MVQPSDAGDATRATLHCLGDLAASVTGPNGTRRLARGKPVALLAFLAAASGRRASRERLGSLLWAEGSSEQARQNLRQTIWYLKRRLGDWVIATDDFLELAAGVEVDRDVFLRAVRENRLRDAVAAYGGEFVPDFAAPGAADFEQWADLERRRLRGVFVGCCDTLARQALASGQFASAAELARAARDAAPLDFATWRLLLESLTAARDALACLAEAEHLEALASAEDLPLDDATRAAVRAARGVAAGPNASGHLPPPAASASAAEPPETTGFSPELIGREAEFRTLLERWEHTRNARGGALLVSGVAGLGKTRLLADVQARLRASRARVLALRANPGDRAVGSGFLAAVAESLAQRPGAAAVSEESAAVLVALAPALASAYPRARPDGASGEDALRRRANALLDLVRAVSEETALALFIDDVHWADAESRRVLDAVAARLEGGRVLLVLAARPPLESLGGFATLPRLELARFDLARVAEFITRLGELPTEPWAAELPSQLLATTRGIPLTLIEALARLVETGALQLREHRWSSDAPARITEVLRQGMVLEARVRSLGAGAREALLLLAVLGRPVPAAQLAAPLGATGDAAEDPRLLEAEHRGLIVRRDGLLGVAHDEIADAAVASASREEVQEAHRRAARLLAEVSGQAPRLDLALRHAVASGDVPLLRELSRAWLRQRRTEGDGAGASELLREVLGADAPPSASATALAAIPFWERPAKALLRGAAAAMALVLGSAVLLAMAETEQPDLRVIVQLEGSDVPFATFTIDRLNDWEPSRPIALEPIDSAALPSGAALPGRPLVISHDGGRSWVGHAFFADSGEEVITIDPNGALRRPAPARGDDGLPSLSPDGRWLAFTSARWHRSTDRYQVAIVARDGGPVRRLVPSEDFQALPAWSPDGSRIAFEDVSFTSARPRRICVATVDGAELDCEHGTPEAQHLLGWLDGGRLLVEERTTGALSVLDLETDRMAAVAGERLSYPVAGAPGLLIGAADQDRGGVQSLAIARVGEAAIRPLLLNGEPVRGRAIYVAVRSRLPYVDRIVLQVPSAGVAVDVPHRLRAVGLDSAGNPLRAFALRFHSLDDSIAVVKSGLLRGLRPGRARIVATSGGWRSDTAVIAVVPNAATAVLREAWDERWESRWRPLGTPAPRVERGSEGPEFLPNGDGRYPSGAYLRQRVASRDGVGVEFELSTPFNQYQWQGLALDITEGPARAALDAWDHVAGDWPLHFDHACSFASGGDGADAMLNYLIASGTRPGISVPTTARARSGAFTRIRVQLFPDGRCGLAVDGRAVAIAGRAAHLPDSLRIRVTGHSVGTRIAVRRLDVWTGTKGGVNWAAVERD